MQPETRFKNRIMPKLKKLKNTWIVKTQQVAIRGTPDILMCVAGTFVALELKVPPNKVKRGSLQEKNLTDINKAGGYATEVNPQNFETIYKNLVEMSELGSSYFMD